MSEMINANQWYEIPVDQSENLDGLQGKLWTLLNQDSLETGGLK